MNRPVAATAALRGKQSSTRSPRGGPSWDALLTDAGADEVRDEVRVTIEQHALLAGAFPKFGFEGSVGI